MDPLIRFSSLVRHGLRFRSRLDRIKGDATTPGFVWYPYDSFANLFPLEQLRRKAGLTMADAASCHSLRSILHVTVRSTAGARLANVLRMTLCCPQPMLRELGSSMRLVH